MKHKMLHTTLAVLSSAVLLAGVTPAAHAAACTRLNAAGNWSVSDSGTVVGVGPRVAAGRFTLDADGNLLNGVATSSLNGSIAAETFSGTYTVNPDCTGTISIKIFSSGTELFAVTLHIAFDDNVQEIRGIFTSVVRPNGMLLPTVIAAEARKQSPSVSD